MTPTRETILRLTAERDAALKSAADWEIRAQDAADRARRLEEELAQLRSERRGSLQRHEMLPDGSACKVCMLPAKYITADYSCLGRRRP